MSKSPAKRKPNATLRWVLMLAGVIVVFGGVFLIKGILAKGTNDFFDNMPQPAVAVSSHVAKTQRWSDDGEAVGTGKGPFTQAMVFSATRQPTSDTKAERPSPLT